MPDRQLARPKSDLLARLCIFIIALITIQRVISRGELNADLMRAAGLQPDEDLRETIAAFKHIILQFGILPFGIDFDHVGPMILQKMVGKDIVIL